MDLIILTPERKVFAGTVYGVSLPGVEGSFSVLDHHAAMIAALGTGKMRVFKDNSMTNCDNYEISGGFIEVLNNKASVVLEGAKPI